MNTHPWLLGVSLLAAALLAMLAVRAPSASAHSAYDHSTPGEGEVVATAPTKIDVYFAEEMERANGLPTLVVLADDGDVVDKGAVLDDADRTHISAELNDGLEDGRYTVIWHNVSADDGDEAQGAFYFYVGVGPSATSAASTTAQATATPVASTPATKDDDSGDIPIWGLIAGIIGGVVVGGAAGAVLGRRSGS
jgi:methionine-rich copper-binding protein CopC